MARCPTEMRRGVAGRSPFRSGVGRDAGVEEPAALVRQHEEYVQDLKADCRYSEEVDRQHGLNVIIEEGPPGL